MPHELSWLIEGEVIYNRNWGDGTLEETREIIREFREFLDQSDRPFIHFLIDNRDLTSSPSLISSTKVVREEPPHPRAGWLVSVQVSNPILHFFTDVTMQLTKQRYRSFHTLPEAIAFLKEADGTVSWDKLPEAFKA